MRGYILLIEIVQ